jgi:oligosaccharide reducing-end xylanase
MRIYMNIFLVLLVICFTACASINTGRKTNLAEIEGIKKGSFYTGKYPNLFKELLGKSDEEINAKIKSVFDQLFYGNNESQRVYYPVGKDMAHIEDVNNHDVRSEGMSYGMMIALQLDKKEEFDRLWKWAKTFMQHQNGPRKDYFAWHCKTSGEIIDPGSASDGEEWIVTTLFMAATRWGNGQGIFNYKAEAQKILDAMISKVEFSDKSEVITNVFSKKEKLIVFVPDGVGDDFTDPSYHLPHFYELWNRWADKENNFWLDVAGKSREYLKKAVNQRTGLAPDYSKFDGTPHNPWNGGTDNFQFDAWRVAMNIAIDYTWFGKDEWQVTQSNRLLNFFYSIGIKTYGNVFVLDGKKLSDNHSLGLVSANAVAALASTNENRKEFVQELWNGITPTGKYRYYDGLLYMLGLLEVSGNYRIYDLNAASISK